MKELLVDKEIINQDGSVVEVISKVNVDKNVSN
jgi:hypothetical protein